MGLKDWFDRKRRGYTDFDEMMNPLVSARLQHFVCIKDVHDPYVRHYFQFLNKAEGANNENSLIQRRNLSQTVNVKAV